MHLLNNHNFDINFISRYGESCLIIYCRGGGKNPEVVKALLNAGADPSIKIHNDSEDNGKTAYDLAVEEGSSEIADVLAKAQAKSKG